jgi:quercetin dioxygenase-like cupin family protein
MKVHLGSVVHDAAPGSLVFIPAGLPHYVTAIQAPAATRT